MTEALDDSQIFFLRRAAAAGHVTVETDGDRKTLDELIVFTKEVPPMPDDKSKVGEPDRSRVAADQNYEVRYLSQQCGLAAL